MLAMGTNKKRLRMKATQIPNYLWSSFGLPLPKPEYRFLPDRRYRIDYAYPDRLLAIEIEGGVWTHGRHTRGSGFVGDIEKYNLLTEYGWHLLRYQPNRVDFNQIVRVYTRLEKVLF
jgi:very-short-patch-repair endonuclease